ncbi:SR-related and CTD-associated factor 4 [Folsomia candida]|nr:SR-related and CTD-associated factor 4 [Folsomia candida]
MIRNIFAVTLLLGVACAFPHPQAPPLGALPAPGPNGVPPPGPNGLPPHPPGCLPPLPPNQGPPGSSPASLPPPPNGPDGKPLPTCPPTLISGHCGGVTYFWDTAKGEDQPADFKKCFFGDGEVGAICNGKEYTWDPAKQEKPAELEACEKKFNGQ